MGPFLAIFSIFLDFFGIFLGTSGRRADPPTGADRAISGTFLTQHGQKIDFSGVKNWPQNGPKMSQKWPKMVKLVVIRTLGSSQSDVPVYVVFLQGVLTVPVGCLAK